MRNIMRKAQTATEYLIILAVVIIIALIVIGALGGIPGIGGGASANAATASWSTGAVAVDSIAIDQNGGLDLTLKNNRPNSIQVNDVWMNTTISSRNNGLALSNDTGNWATQTLNPGGTLTFSNSSFMGSAFCTAGSSVTLYMTVEYQELDTSATFNYTNNNQPLEVTCAAS